MITREKLREACPPPEQKAFGKEYRLSLRIEYITTVPDLEEDAGIAGPLIQDRMVEQVYNSIYGDLLEPIETLIFISKHGARSAHEGEAIQSAAQRVLDLLK